MSSQLQGGFVSWIARGLAGAAKRIVVTGFNAFCSESRPRRALLSYLVIPLLRPRLFRNRVKFSNHGIAQELPRALNELGYAVDIVNYDNRSWRPAQPYDLFIGHGGINFEHISRRLPAKTVRIYFSTGTYWREANTRLARRLYELAKRRGYLLPPYRSVMHDEEYANAVADGIICLGNKLAVETYSGFRRAIAINNAIFPCNWDDWRTKHFGEARKHFLFFAGRGCVLKGLDLVLEAFAGTDLHLHICQHIESEFWHVFRHELREHSNIHVHGYVRPRLKIFEGLARLCNWVVSASCTEGQPGAILECMGHGLIPIVPDCVHIDVGEWGIRLASCDVMTIRSTMIEASKMAVEECRRRSSGVVEMTRTTYTAEKFRHNLREGISGIVSEVLVRGGLGRGELFGSYGAQDSAGSLVD